MSNSIIDSNANKEHVKALFVILAFGAFAMLYISFQLFVLAYGGWTWWALLAWLIACQISRLSKLSTAIDILFWVFVYPFVLGLILAWF